MGKRLCWNYPDLDVKVGGGWRRLEGFMDILNIREAPLRPPTPSSLPTKILLKQKYSLYLIENGWKVGGGWREFECNQSRKELK